MSLPPYTFQGGVAVVTDAASRMGRALALQLAGWAATLPSLTGTSEA